MVGQVAGKSETERILDGLVVQLKRTEKFQNTIDPAGTLETYRRLVELLYPRCEELRTQVGLPARPGWFADWRQGAISVRRAARQPAQHQVWTYWDKPLDQAPPLVQACLRQTVTVQPQFTVLNAATAGELVEIPRRVSSLLEHDRPAHFSDYVRTAVLERHGGIWVDATLWLPGTLDASAKGLLRSGVVLPRYTRRGIANWFIAAQPGSLVMGLQRRALELWWNTFDDLPDYFLYHRIFDVLCSLVPEFRGQWYAARRLSATTTHGLQLEMMMPLRPDRLAAIQASAPMQKLSYKYDEVPEGSVLEYLLGTNPTVVLP